MPAPIRNNPTAPTAPTTNTTPATPTPAPATTQPTRPQAWGPATGPAPRPASDGFANVAGAVTGRVGELLRNQGASPYQLIPGRYPTTVGLPQVLQALASSPQGGAAATKLLEKLQQQTGIALPPTVIAAVKANPAALTNALEVTPAQMQSGIGALNQAYRAGKVKNPEPRKDLLPQKFDLSTIDSLDLPRPKSELKELAPGLFTGDVASTASDAQVKQNRVMSEVFQRLARNPTAAADQKFEVTFNGKAYSRMEDFLGALDKAGYDVSVRFDSRVANFAALKTAVPGTNPPQLVDVPAPLMVKTGIKDGSGKEAVVPAAHSEMMVFIKAGPNAQGPKLDATTRYYQGTSGTGFFPADVHAEPEWLGRASSPTLSGKDAMKAVKLAGAFTDVVEDAARRLDLYADGYGITGVCNDSVAVVQQAVTGNASQYPLLMNDDVLLGELKKRLSDGDRTGDATYRALKKAIIDLPSDTRPNPSAQRRALSSLPWTEGKEPFQSTVDARRILGG
ncbi:MAG: hypothetical protein JNJ54_11505 [Myxococcaceae bacterium]|nr:hypothetical protein [Myxococcaceae bacterium]